MGTQALQSSSLRRIQDGLSGLVPDLFPDIFPGMFDRGDASKDPAIGAEGTGKGYSYGSVTGDAFRQGGDKHVVALNDIDQGDLGDCYFLAALETLAKSNPDWIKCLIKENKDAKDPTKIVSYSVTFYDYWGDPVTETVTPSFPVDAAGNPVYAQPTTDGQVVAGTYELWPMIMEKAYAQWYEGYDEIEVGYVDTALEHLTGESATFHYRGYNYDWLWGLVPEPVLDWFTRMNDAFVANKAVCVTTNDNLDKKGTLATATNGVSVSGSHAYVVMSVNLKGADSTVTLYNPHGKNHPILNLKQFETCVKRYGCLDDALV